MRHYAIRLQNRTVFISTEMSLKDLETEVSKNINHLINQRKSNQLKNDQFAFPEKYPDLPDSQHSKRKTLILNDFFKIGSLELYLVDFYDFDKEESLFYEVLTVAFVEDQDRRD